MTGIDRSHSPWMHPFGFTAFVLFLFPNGNITLERVNQPFGRLEGDSAVGTARDDGDACLAHWHFAQTMDQHALHE